MARKLSAVPAVEPDDGDLAVVLTERPIFRRTFHGYDQVQVETYVEWAESELASLRRALDEAFARYGRLAVEAAELRGRLARDTEDRTLSEFTGRLEQMLRLAAEEAVEIRLSAALEAERLLGTASAAHAAQIIHAGEDGREAAEDGTNGPAQEPAAELS
jgi:cell division septum initiation protein DivIVA